MTNDHSKSQESDPEASAWARNALQLAQWAYCRLRNRDDVHGAYRRLALREAFGPVYTAHEATTQSLLERHFTGADPSHILGLHAMAPDETCRWVAIDVDAHDDKADAQANWRLAFGIFQKARDLGLDALLVDSNGKGGFHIWILFEHPVPGQQAWLLGKWLIREHRSYGLCAPPEVFPKSPRLSGKRFGNWVRLPGRHHSREFWSRAWDGQRWLTGERAIRAILAVQGRDFDIEAIVPKDFIPRGKAGQRQTLPSPPLTRSTEEVRQNVALAREALAFLGEAYYDDYTEWLRVGMALCELGESGLELWNEWSSQSAKYEASVLADKWNTFTPGAGVSLGSLFFIARLEGWFGPKRARRSRYQGVSLVLRSTRTRCDDLDQGAGS